MLGLTDEVCPAGEHLRTPRHGHVVEVSPGADDHVVETDLAVGILELEGADKLERGIADEPRLATDPIVDQLQRTGLHGSSSVHRRDS